MTDAERQSAISQIVAECGDNLNLIHAAQIAWAMHLTITGPDGIGALALDAALEEARAARSEIRELEEV